MISTDLAWIARSLLRAGGWGCIVRIEAHFDESGTHARELTLAGYLFEASKIDEFCTQWAEALAKHDLPYFHMVDCAHGAPPFDNMEKNDCIRLQMRLMRLIKRFSVNGIVCNIKNVKNNSGQSYKDAAQQAARLAAEWAAKVSYSEKIAYFFESGASGQGLVDGWFHEVARDPSSAAFYHYGGHAFVPKNGNPGVQAADLLAWQYHNFTKKRAKNNLARLDLRALLRHPHLVFDKCGSPPRESKHQSIKASRSRIETVYYLPAATQGQISDAAVIAPSHDFTPMRGNSIGHILACPSCLRAVCEDLSVTDVRSRIKVDHHFIIKCWCGTHCLIPEAMIPSAFT